MEEKPLVEQDFPDNLKQVIIHDITAMSTEEKMRWTYIFSKMNPDVTFASEWIEKRLLVYPKNKLTDAIFLFYSSYMHSTVTNGQLSMLMGGEFKEEDKEKLKKTLDWIPEQLIVGVPEPDGKSVKFAVFPLSAFQIIQEQAFSVEQEKPVRNQLIYQIEQKNAEIKNLIEEYKAQWLK
jgi:hypothetical protein